MSTYRIDKRDVEFALFDHAGVDRLTELPPYEDYSRELFEMVLGQALRFTEEELAPRNAEADAAGVRFEDGQVILPAVYEEIYDAFCESGFIAPMHSAEYGGQGLPAAIGAALMEFFIGANPSFSFIPGLTSSAGHLLETFGSQSLKDVFVEKLYTGQWGGTMCLTEPQAGSAVGELKTSATPVDGEEFYRITGNKIFISQGDHQLVDNIIHLVLARADGDPDGIKGISLFAVPKYRVNDDGSLGEFNDVRVTGLEEKMGIHASPTCAMSFGDEGDCRGWLIGERCQGIVYMFQMMNEARLACGLQGVALGNVAYQIALEYARERTQGSKVTDRGADAPTVPIIAHPDVRRNLMTCKAYGEAIRAMLYSAAVYGDRAQHAPDDAERTKSQDLLDLLTPICKAFATDVGFKMTELAMQVLGGYGYITEYGIEQRMRDVKIASIYEGTNGIQALDLLGRKMRQKNGGLFLTWMQDVNGFIERLRDDAMLGDVVTEFDSAKNALAEAAFGFGQSGKKNPEYPLLHATPFLRMFGLVHGAYMLLEQAEIARDKLVDLWEAKSIAADDDAARAALVEQNEEARFLENKLLTARFYVYQLLPEVAGLLHSVQSGDTSALDAFIDA